MPSVAGCRGQSIEVVFFGSIKIALWDLPDHELLVVRDRNQVFSIRRKSHPGQAGLCILLREGNESPGVPELDRLSIGSGE